MESKQVQLYLDREKMIEASPETSANCVILSDGNDLQKVLNNDLTTPTVVHEETSFKVGVGDIDVSGSIVDGEVGRMVIKGQTYQNILPEPSTHVLTNNKEMFKVNEGLDPNVEIVDGVSKSAILKGNTLVNLLNGDNIEQRPSSNTSAICGYDKETRTFHFITNLSYPYSYSYISTYNADKNGVARHLKNNTDYTIMWYGEKIRDDDDSQTFIKVGASSSAYGDPNYFTNVVNIKTGKMLYRTQTSYEDSIVRLLGIRVFNVSNDIEYKLRFVILEGDYTNFDIPYFEGMKSVRMPVLTTTGKNLFDVNKGKEFVYNRVPFTKFDGSVYTIHVGSVDSVEIENDSIILNNITYANTVQLQTKHYVDEGVTYNISIINESGTSIKVRGITYYNQYGEILGGYWDRIGEITPPKGCNYLIVGYTCGLGNGRYKIQFEQGTTSTTYEPYKTNILSTSEDVVLRGIGDVKDELNLLTGEVTESVSEVVLDGTNTPNIMFLEPNRAEGYTVFPMQISDVFPNMTVNYNNYTQLISNNFNYLVGGYLNRLAGKWMCINAMYFVLSISNDELESLDIQGLNKWLSLNKTTIYYPSERSIKTVDLSSSGNWEKIVLDGSSDELWRFREKWREDGTLCFSIPMPEDMKHNGMNQMIGIMSDKFKPGFMKENSIFTGYLNERVICLCFNPTVVSSDLDSVRAWLSQNPVTVWYQTTNHQDSTQVKQPIFFKDGHIQLSSGADNSLIPTLDYQAKTSNSYVVDLIKSNTQYTMKAKSASGTFTIDGTSYGAGTNGTFTTPTSMTNKLLVMSNNANEEVMIIEGDVTDKTIPYFKGIKSAFEGESKIEVLSTGKNLIKKEEFKEYILKYHPHSTFYVEDGVEYCKTVNSLFHNKPFMKGQFKKGTRYTMTLKAELKQENKGLYLAFRYTDDTYSSDYTSSTNPTVLTVTSSKDKVVDYVYLSYSNGGDVVLDLDSFQLTETDSRVEYEPYKSNSTKIPLLSPLRSLPNGVCDELIIDRMKKKVTLIQRVGYGVLGRQGHGYNYANSSINTNLYQPWYTKDLGDNVANSTNANTMLCDKLLVTYENYTGRAKESIGMYPDKSANFTGCLLKTTLGAKTVKQWFEANEVSVYYQLETPVVTEIDLENFPLVYKDGHIFLNSEIAPVVEIDYNVNQAQLIIGNGETLLRHEQEILDLDKLIVSFVDCEYRLRLLKFDMELSMMSL